MATNAQTGPAACITVVESDSSGERVADEKCEQAGAGAGWPQAGAATKEGRLVPHSRARVLCQPSWWRYVLIAWALCQTLTCLSLPVRACRLQDDMSAHGRVTPQRRAGSQPPASIFELLLCHPRSTTNLKTKAHGLLAIRGSCRNFISMPQRLYS